MVQLINIEKTDEFISCEYIPEASEEKGYIKMDLQGNVIVKIPTSFDHDYLPEDYSSFAIRRLRKLLSVDSVPKESLVMWY